MKLEKGRPVITASDFPETIEAALRVAIPAFNRQGLEEHERWRRVHRMTDMYESLQDVFELGAPEEARSPRTAKGEVVLYMTPQHCADTLKIYEQEQDIDPAELERVELLLGELEALQQAI
jgi:hypothetical protein